MNRQNRARRVFTGAIILCAFALNLFAHTPAVAAGYAQVNLVSDIAGLAPSFDHDLQNPWGIVASATGPFWISDNNDGLSTFYSGTGAKFGTITVPPPAGTSIVAAPDGIVYNATGQFKVSASGASGSPFFIFSTEDGTISGWSPSVDHGAAILAVDNSASGAVYKGLALVTNAQGNFLFVTNFRDDRVEIYDSNYQWVSSFTDPFLPAGYAPFGIQVIGDSVFVTFAKQNDQKHDDVAGPGFGFVDEFTTSGAPVRHLAAGGSLNSPWGIALAPANFGAFSNDLLIGNFGDGRISAFDPSTGAFQGYVRDAHKRLIHIDGLWGLDFGNGQSSGPTNWLYFTAGPNQEHDGLFGYIVAN